MACKPLLVEKLILPMRRLSSPLVKLKVELIFIVFMKALKLLAQYRHWIRVCNQSPDFIINNGSLLPGGKNAYENEPELLKYVIPITLFLLTTWH